MACAALVCGSASAQAFDKFTGVFYQGMSSNGNYLMGGMYGTVTVLDRLHKKSYVYEDTSGADIEYSAGLGHNLALDGSLVGSTGSEAVVWKDGNTIVLPQVGLSTGVNGANAITDDGKYIVGDLGIEDASFGAEGTMTFPVIWTKGEDGEYTYEALPFPKTDFLGLAPQYVMANDISNDGKTIIGQVRDCTGFYSYPIIYTKGEDGTWTYKEVYDFMIKDKELFNQIPQPPVLSVAYPEVKKYMSDASKAKYNAYVDAYNDKMDQYKGGLIPRDSLLPWPIMQNFIIEEDSLAHWKADSTAYEEASAQYMEDYYARQKAIRAAFTNEVMQFNSLNLSRNGKYLGATFEYKEASDDPDDLNGGGKGRTYPVMFDVTDNLKIYRTNGNDVEFTNIADDGTMIGATPSLATTRTSLVYTKGDADGQRLDTYLATRNVSAADFFKKEFSFTVPMLNEETNLNEAVNDSIVTGTTFINPDATIFVSYLEDEYTPAIKGGILDGNGDTDPGIGDDDVIAWSAKKKFRTTSDEAVKDGVDDSDFGGVDDGADDDFGGAGDDNNGVGDNTADYNQYYLSFYIDLNEGAISGIKSAKNEKAEASVVSRMFYNMQGQRVLNPAQRGVYIEKTITTKGAYTTKRVK